MAEQLALIVTRAGVEVVVGCDVATNWLEKARHRTAAEGLAHFYRFDYPFPPLFASFRAVSGRPIVRRFLSLAETSTSTPTS